MPLPRAWLGKGGGRGGGRPFPPPRYWPHPAARSSPPSESNKRCQARMSRITIWCSPDTEPFVLDTATTPGAVHVDTEIRAVAARLGPSTAGVRGPRRAQCP